MFTNKHQNKDTSWRLAIVLLGLERAGCLGKTIPLVALKPEDKCMRSQLPIASHMTVRTFIQSWTSTLSWAIAPGAGSIQGQRPTVPEVGITPSKNKKELSEEDNLEN